MGRPDGPPPPPQVSADTLAGCACADSVFGFHFGACYQATMSNDSELLRRYVFEKSEAAFTELVERHVNLVYAAALRQVGGDAHLAEDVTQRVFVALARKAAMLVRRPVISGWLYRSAQFAASDVVRAERRRRAREQEAQTMHDMTRNQESSTDWKKLRHVLDEAIGGLSERDRDIIVLRFFEGRAFAEIGAVLRWSIGDFTSESSDPTRTREASCTSAFRCRISDIGCTTRTTARRARHRVFTQQSPPTARFGRRGNRLRRLAGRRVPPVP
ncbi:MAG TPA: sigma-70 family RNA polymerase sigma factor [Opitutus sp.]|nr:sigma-70 family RNA polymerase sigma factor [Opitutus sp.]